MTDYTPTTAEVREEGVKSVRPKLDGVMTLTVAQNPYQKGTLK